MLFFQGRITSTYGTKPTTCVNPLSILLFWNILENTLKFAPKIGDRWRDTFPFSAPWKLNTQCCKHTVLCCSSEAAPPWPTILLIGSRLSDLRPLCTRKGNSVDADTIAQMKLAHALPKTWGKPFDIRQYSSGIAELWQPCQRRLATFLPSGVRGK